VDGLYVCFLGHVRVFPVIPDLAGKLSAFAAVLEALLSNRAVVDHAGFKAKVLDVKRLSLAGKTISTALLFEGTFVTVDSTG